jgi:hypothetical protein
MHRHFARFPVRARVIALATTSAVLFALVIGAFIGVGAASSFASPAFQTQWNSVESVIPNFWGPLSTARDGQAEPYVEGSYNGQTGMRLVQYFDKARMELTTPTSPVTNGLLTVELKSGQLQLGDNSFQQQAAANIGIAGDPNTPGPTYASLAQLPEKSPQASGSVNLGYDVASNTFVTTPPSTDPATTFAAYISDPSGRFGQNVPQAFVTFLNKIPGGYLSAMGYAISPAFAANVQVAGKPNVPVIIQAFQRKVLTYTASNPAAFQVEFGNIGQHYYTWRYSGNPAPTASGTTASGATSAPIFTNVQDTSLTVVYTTTTAVCGTADYRVQGTTEWTTVINNFSCVPGLTKTSHSIDLSGLTPNTTYEVRPAVKDTTQTISYGPVGTVTTAAASPVVISPINISNLTDTSVVVSYTTNIPTCGIVQYRTSGNETWGADEDISAPCDPSVASTTHNKNLTGIAPNTSIDVRAAVKAPGDTVVHYGRPVTFTTSSSAATPTAAPATPTTAPATPTTAPATPTPAADTPTPAPPTATPGAGSPTPGNLPSPRP